MTAFEDYVHRLDAGLKSLPAEERDRIVLEIRGHLAERGDAALGRPETLARTYMEDYRMTQALARSNSGALFLVVLDRASRSFGAAAVGFAALVCYMFAVAFGLVAALKPFFPDQVGFWLHPFKFGVFIGDMPSSPELLGWNIIPISGVLAVGCWLLAGPILHRGAERLIRPVFGD